MKEIFNKYIIIGEFISKIMGEKCEVVIHDVSNPENSILWMDKGHLSGRALGDSFTDLSVLIMKTREYETKDYIVNYEGNGNGSRRFISSTYFIKDDDGELQGFLCINNDVTDFLEFKALFARMEGYFGNTTNDYKESVSSSIYSIADKIIQDTISGFNIPVGRMKKGEKIEVVRQLHHMGIFDIKGGAIEAAKSLGISEPTLYRYLKEID